MMSDTGNPKNTCGKVVVVSGPSGVGKSTICREVIKRLADVYLSVSVTTRPKGPGEQDGRDYGFLSEPEFRRRIEEGTLLEYAEVFGNLYGTRQAKAAYPEAALIFILPPTEKDLAERMGRRGRDSARAAEVRLGGASNEIAAAWQLYDNMVINEDLEQAVGEVLQIIERAPAIGQTSDNNEGNVGEQEC